MDQLVVLLIIVSSLFSCFLIAVGIACYCCMGHKSRAEGTAGCHGAQGGEEASSSCRFTFCCFGRWIWDLFLALLHLFEASTSLLVIVSVYTQKPPDFQGTPTSTQPLFIVAITVFSLWLVVCPILALIPCLRSTCAGCCSGRHSYVPTRSRSSSNNNNGKGGGGAILILLLLLATAPLWIWMGYNFASACVASIYRSGGDKDKSDNNNGEEDNDVDDRRWAAALESWLRSKKAHAPYFLSCLGTIFLLVIEIFGVAVLRNSGILIHPLQHLSISLKIVSLVCKGYCLCAGSLQFKAALFKYTLVLFDLFSFVYALVALSEYFSTSGPQSSEEKEEDKEVTLSSLFTLLLVGSDSWTSVSRWWIRVFLFKISYIGLSGGVCQMVWWVYRNSGQVKPVCWLWSTFLTIPISVIVSPLLECAKLSWLLLPLSKIEPEIQNCIVHLDTLNLVESGLYSPSPLLPNMHLQKDMRSERLKLLKNIHLEKIESDMNGGKRALSPFFPCFLVLSPYFLGHLFSCLFPAIHLISSERRSFSNPYLIASFAAWFLAGITAGCLAPSSMRYAEYCTLFCHNRLSSGTLRQIRFSLRTSLATPLDTVAVSVRSKEEAVSPMTIPQPDYSIGETQPKWASLSGTGSQTDQIYLSNQDPYSPPEAHQLRPRPPFQRPLPRRDPYF